MTAATAKKATAPKSATIASMTPKPAKKQPETPPAAPAAPEFVFDWEQEFEPVKVKEYTRNEPPTIDYEAATPAFVKQRVIDAFAATEEALKKGITRPVWVDQPFAKVEYVAEFDKLARKYAGFKGWTYRCPTEANRPNKLVATFAVKPKEHRAKKAVPAVAPTGEAPAAPTA